MSRNLTKEDGIRLQEFTLIFEKQGLDAGFEKLEEYFTDYRDHERFLYCAIEFLASAVAIKEVSPEKRDEYTNKVVSYLEILNKSEDESVIIQSALKMFYIAIEKKDYKKAEQILSTVEDTDYSDELDIALAKAELLMKTNQADVAAQIMEQELYSSLISLQLVLTKLAKAEAKAGETETANKIADIYQKANQLFDLKKYDAYKAPLEVAIANQDAEECISVIDKTIGEFSQPWTPEKSPLFFRGAFKDTSVFYQNAIPSFLEALEKRPEVAFLRENDKFEKMIEKYRAE